MKRGLDSYYMIELRLKYRLDLLITPVPGAGKQLLQVQPLLDSFLAPRQSLLLA